MTAEAETETLSLAPELERAVQQAQAEDLPYAGIVPPAQAFELVKRGQAILVDVRTTEERKFVGHVPDSLHVAWATGTALNRNPRFARELAALVAKQAAQAEQQPDQPLPVLLLCRSGKRSALAAAEAAKAGIELVFNISEGFEGDLDAAGQRGHFNGWRFHGLPWVQD